MDVVVGKVVVVVVGDSAEVLCLRSLELSGISNTQAYPDSAQSHPPPCQASTSFPIGLCGQLTVFWKLEISEARIQHVQASSFAETPELAWRLHFEAAL